MMRNLMKTVGIGVILLAVTGGAFVLARNTGWTPWARPASATATAESAGTEIAAAGETCPHSLIADECPFCTPSLIESKGFCNGHGVPEALCHLCDPSVIPAFKAQGDWCEEHDAPESLCPVCNPGAGLKYKEGGAEAIPATATTPAAQTGASASCPHDLQREECPWCTPKLMVDGGFCREHNVPEAFCALCNPDIIPGLKAMGDWCEEHGQSETFCEVCGSAATVDRAAETCPHDLAPADCPFCTPELIVSKGFCNGHGVPEAFCHLCDPGVIPAFKARGDWCEEHNAPESLCPVCSPAFADPEPELMHKSEFAPENGGIEIVRESDLRRLDVLGPIECDTETLRVRLAPGMSDRIGLTLTEVQRQGFTEQHTFNAQLDYDRNRLASLAPRAPGVIAEIAKEIGDSVREGEVMAVIDSVAIGNAKAELLQAAALVDVRLKDHEREQRLLERGVSTEKDRLAAEAALAEANVALSRARQTLRNLGLNDKEIDRVRSSGDTGSHLALTAPFEGVVIERNAALGEVVDVNAPLFRIANTTRMWAMIDVDESELTRIRRGQTAVFRPDSLKDRPFAGRIAWISSAVDPQTRTLRARVELPNGEGLLKANMFGRAEVIVRDGEPATIVPKEAVQWEGCCHIVFERLSDMMYAPRRVKLGHALKDHYEIESGVAPGTQVVAGASFLLKTEIMKGSIGAGCCEIEPGAA